MYGAEVLGEQMYVDTCNHGMATYFPLPPAAPAAAAPLPLIDDNQLIGPTTDLIVLRVDLLATTTLALALAGLECGLLVALQVSEEAAENVTSTTGLGIGALGITSTDSTTSEATQV